MASHKVQKILTIILTISAFSFAASTLAVITVNQNIGSSGTVTTSPNIGSILKQRLHKQSDDNTLGINNSRKQHNSNNLCQKYRYRNLNTWIINNQLESSASKYIHNSELGQTGHSTFSRSINPSNINNNRFLKHNWHHKFQQHHFYFRNKLSL